MNDNFVHIKRIKIEYKTTNNSDIYGWFSNIINITVLFDAIEQQNFISMKINRLEQIYGLGTLYIAIYYKDKQ